MILATDVHYRTADSAITAGISFREWPSDKIEGKYIVKIDKVAPYEPGSFYKRELPCILTLMDTIEKKPEVIVIDGYVTLGAEGKPGLGAHLYKALNSEIPVIGVAKNRFSGTPENCDVYRGKSRKPLFVTSIGIDNDTAKDFIRNMHGAYRIPTLIKAVDRECRKAIV